MNCYQKLRKYNSSLRANVIDLIFALRSKEETFRSNELFEVVNQD